jgi:hypothetical protein
MSNEKHFLVLLFLFFCSDLAIQFLTFHNAVKTMAKTAKSWIIFDSLDGATILGLLFLKHFNILFEQCRSTILIMTVFGFAFLNLYYNSEFYFVQIKQDKKPIE